MVSQLALWASEAPHKMRRVVNVAEIPQRSPFRYPGGKTWLVPYVRTWIRSLRRKPKLFVEPFVGGGIISLTVAFENLADHVIAVELDRDVAAVWETLFSDDNDWLANRIIDFDLTLESVKEELAKTPKDAKNRAFHTILRNRTCHGGILAPGSGVLKYGENGKGIKSRWYPQTLFRRIQNIKLIREKVIFIQGDGIEAISKYASQKSAAFFIDPPYTAGKNGKRAGTRLYTHNELDHEELFKQAEHIQGDLLMTYDTADEVIRLASQHGFAARQVSMKNTHHATMQELAIGRNLTWLAS
jgi:DNA adenine methylase